MNELAATKLWVDHWRRVGPQLRRIEHEELRAFCFEKNWELVDGLFQFGFDVPNAKRPDYSGLVTQQRHFAKARE
jgi:hypothetical protein